MIPGGNALIEGTYEVIATIDNGGGGMTSDVTSNELIIDTTAPSVDIQNEPSVVSNTNTYGVTLQFSEDVVGLDISDITIGNGLASNLVTVNGNTYTLDITPTGGGDITIDVPGAVVQDAAGNNNSAAIQAITLFNPAAVTVDIQNEPVIVNNTSVYNVTFEFSEDVTGFSIGDVSVGNGSASNFVSV